MTSAYGQAEMHIEVQQDSSVANTFILTVYAGWTWDHVAMAATEIQRKRESSDTVHVLIEIEGPIPMPDSIDEMSKYWLDTHMKQHGGLIVFVTEWAMIESLFRLVPVNKTCPLKMVRFAKTMDEAHALINDWMAD